MAERFKLAQIRLSGYKSIAGDGQAVDFGDITVIIGPNGSGKSNLVSFFQMLNMMTTGYLREYVGKQGTANALLHSLKNNRSFNRYYQRIVEHIRMVLPQFEDFELEPSIFIGDYISLNWREKDENEYLFGPGQLSDGSLRFIALAALLLQPPETMPDVIIIGEPELGLHPAAIGILAGMIRTASMHSQVILATQSTRLVDEFEPENIIVAERDSRNNSSIFRKLNHDALSEWLSVLESCHQIESGVLV